MIITTKIPHSVMDIIKFYNYIIQKFRAKLIVKLRKGDKQSQTKVFIAVAIVAACVLVTLNLTHVIHLGSKY